VGLPPGFDPHHPKTLGLDVVTTLAEQLDAHLSVSGGPGTAFRFSFPTRGDSA
jgi:two-component sensor histidine kinase